ncbi:MAG TPA: sigma-70 family RNA polymerase sigma factor [Dokdonella sp.]|uniref:RNA polymerase sigma factor n=1 Tax=Dokdonella sp. TaxID=2291710 RepID=UPI0025C3D00E|nr:sigma-70 family RNA polymerase sigma factor [Dokdonella sp.]MBX3691534.1 sigma-70 family RNA polymerase sigma factor [Dokdonella sp.]MCW5568880.1 sigma-70 family RNA polymerase sigma factor [Dokdonella sp.]HNR91496.1 sigma-70 family RNA polymerase sigma factor [Dokdonella sp.]
MTSPEPIESPLVAEHGADDTRDFAWLAAVARGDRVAFERLYLHHHPRLARFIVRQSGRHDLVDEIVNEAFWIVWSQAARFRGESKPSTWIIGIAWRCLMKSLRRPAAWAASERAERGFDDAVADVTDDARRDLRDWLHAGLALLPPDQRATIELAYFLGQSCEEIATIMECPVGTVKARLFHARVRLRNNLPVLAGDTVGRAP